MRTIVLPLFLALAFGCQRKDAGDQKETNAGPEHAPPGMGQARVGSAAFHLEIASVYERFGDASGAMEHLSQAVSLAEGDAQRAQALSALGRLKEAAGDADGAIVAFERARAEIDKLAAASPGGQGSLEPIGPPGDDLLLRLARLYAAAGRHEEAARVCERGLSQAREAWLRDQFYRLEIDHLRKAGTLEKRIAEKEKALEEKSPDESALHFLLNALGGDGGDGMAPPPASGLPAGQPRAVSPSLIRAYERLLELHPDDPQLRRSLQSLLERAGRVEEAVKVAAAATPMSCDRDVVPLPFPGALHGPSEAVRVRMRAGQIEKAVQEASKIEDLAAREGVSALVAAAQLCLELGRVDLADRAVRRAAQAARTLAEKRQVSFAREQLLLHAGRGAEVEALRLEWKESEDPCLRQAATQRESRSPTRATEPLVAPPRP